MPARVAWAAAAISVLILATAPTLVFWVTDAGPLDFGVYYHAGLAVRAGGDLYGEPLFPRPSLQGEYTYSPFAAILFVILTLLPPEFAVVLWLSASIAALYGLVAISWRPLLDRCAAGPRSLVTAALAAAAMVALPVSAGLSFGQIGILLVLACTVDLVLIRRPYQGVLIGLAAAIKPPMALFVLWFAVTGQWRRALTSGGVLVAAWVLGALLLPSDTWDYLIGGALFDSSRVSPDPGFIQNQSILGAVSRLGGPSLVWILLAACAVAVGFVRARTAVTLGNPVAAVALIGLTMLLVSPISWTHHAIWLVLAAGVLVGAGRHRWRNWAAGAIWAAAVVLPGAAFSLAGREPDYVWSRPWVWLAGEALVLLYAILLVLLPVVPDEPGDADAPSVLAGTARASDRDGRGIESG